MTGREFSIEIIQKLTVAGHIAYWAGGCVRDLLLGKVPNDFDVATSATPQQVRELFGKRRTLAVGESFGVIIVLGPKSAGPIEVATFRTEGEYRDGRRPESVDFCSPEEDSKRRDFTINGMFYDPIADEVHDFVGGQRDLEEKLVRAIGIPHDRMEEDKLRLLRAVRFTALLGFELEAATADAVKAMASQLVVVSVERIAQELRKMLVHPQRAVAVQLCEELRLLQVILPEVVHTVIDQSLEEWNQILDTLANLQHATFETSMAVLLKNVEVAHLQKKEKLSDHTVTAVCKRLKLSNQESEMILWLVSNLGRLQQFPEWTLAEQKKIVVQSHFQSLLEIEKSIAQVTGGCEESLQCIDRFITQRTSQEIDPPALVDGRTFIELGYRPGPEFQTYLNVIRDAQLNEEISTREEAIALLKRMSKSND